MNTKSATTVASDADIRQAAKRLLQGELVAFPTETVYGLGADASNPEAIAKIYAAKGRPNNHPVIVHVTGPEQAKLWTKELPPEAMQLMSAFWPGPLTLILKRADWVDPAVSGGQDSIGIRCPSHPVAQALLQAFEELRDGQPSGVAAPSANRFGRVSPTTAAHVQDEFGKRIKQGLFVLDGGSADVGIESTIVDLSRLNQGHPPALLRPGSIMPADIESVLGVAMTGHDIDAPRVSGALKAHYAPRTPMKLVQPDELVEKAQSWCQSHLGQRLVVIYQSESMEAVGAEHTALFESEQVIWRQMSGNPVYYAHDLYAQLREVDTLKADALLWQDVPDLAIWDGVRDRLHRAAAAF